MFRKLIGVSAVCAAVMLVSPLVAQHIHKAHEQEECRLGDFLCNHAKFHPLYQLLEFITGQSCCHNSEGRPTRDIEDLDAKVPDQQAQIAAGYRYRVWVDGMWCPAKEDTLMRISEAQKEQFRRYKRVNPDLFYSFLEYDHAFAPKATRGPNGTLICPVIYCLYKKQTAM